jgi:hypothetical protein
MTSLADHHCSFGRSRLNNASLFEEVKEAQAEAEAASKLAEKANEAKALFFHGKP